MHKESAFTALLFTGADFSCKIAVAERLFNNDPNQYINDITRFEYLFYEMGKNSYLQAMKARLMDTGLGGNRQFRVKQVDEYFLNAPFHFHESCEIVLIEEGYGKRIVGDHVDDFEKNDLVLMGPNLPHIWQNDNIYFKKRKQLRVKATVLYFEPAMVLGLVEGTEAAAAVQSLFSKACRGLAIKSGTHAYLLERFADIRASDGLKRLAVFLDIIDILSKTNDYEFLASDNYRNAIKIKDAGRFNDVYQFLMTNFHREIPLEEIAGVAKMSPTAFCRYFKTRTQKSFITFLQEIRVSHACKLLRQDKLSITDIALESGYNNLVNFNKYFKGITALSPSEYRKKTRRDIPAA
ncbi:AraC family transcriptional regulator [Chitinophaga sp. 22321]|uniref:Helix-turn-helix domain-containing protein n=1 Tax=Chitinophaga hostae TaxID=2831022 RepID=A0ABS5IW28_9BACT|nr:AraC family transcriptional regulator [Chitinophaga hostae]MBS0027168.1 helix-turn-helix domain-containing protein [Chitinophaga hostae]